MTQDRVVEYLRHVLGAASAHEREDLVARLREAAERLARPGIVICVAGDFKQGKSALINALLGVDICPVDADLSTAVVMVLRHAAEPGVTVVRRDGRKRLSAAIPVAELATWVTERGNPENIRGLELVEVRLPNPLLDMGITIIDTPGLGGIDAAQAAAALAFLPLADALLFVTDASAELSALELDFLARARERCPATIVALSKVDLYPAWRRVGAATGVRLRDAGMSQAVMPTSAEIRAAAIARGDDQLDRESGIPALFEHIRTEVLDRSSRLAQEQAVRATRDAIAQLRQPVDRELEALRDPSSAAEQQRELDRAREGLDRLRGPAARWSQRLADRFSELSSAVDYQFRAATRGILRDFDAAIDAGDPGTRWDEIASGLQGSTATAVGAAFDRVLEGVDAARDELATLIADEELAHAGSRGGGMAVEDLWSARPVGRSLVRGGVGIGLGGLRGAQGGTIMIGMVSNLFGIALVGPVLLAAAAAFAARSVLEERRRQLAQRRQEARVAGRQFVDDVQFEVGTRLRDLLRDLQRELRDEVSGRMEELSRTYAASAAAIQKALNEDAARRGARTASLEEEAAAYRELDARCADLTSSLRDPAL